MSESEPDPAVLALRDLGAGYGARAVVRGASLEVRRGELLGLVGPNAAGKSTLARCALGLLPYTGSCAVLGREARDYTRREMGRVSALVPQELPAELSFTVREIVLMGRAPHLGLLGLEGARDREIAEAAMREADVAHLAGRAFDRLSGGERRRATLARAFAQEPRLLVLDEPTAALDLGHQLLVLERVRARCAKGLAALAILHDLNLAAAFCDRVALLHGGRIAAAGLAKDVLRPDAVAEAFGADVELLPGPRGPVLVPARSRIG